VRETAHRHSSGHGFPSHAFREVRDDSFQRNAIKAGAACCGFAGFHVFILHRIADHGLYNVDISLPIAFVMTTPVRLAKRLIELTHCSRREAELFIAGGWVTVDGQVVEEPQFMVAEQNVELRPDAILTPVDPTTMLFHQPLTTEANATLHPIRASTRASDDPSGIKLLKLHFVRLTPCMPLEPIASGLMVYTQDWRISRKLLDDAATVEQEYIVEVTGELIPHGLKRLNHGLTFNGKALPPIKVSWQNETRLRFALKGVQPGQIKYMCESVGLTVVAMKRIRIGRVAMAKLQPGQWRYLMPEERF
jgi:23S rRNA pseudouridine2604 synthase